MNEHEFPAGGVITSFPIDTHALRASVDTDVAGAVVTFAGIVRNHDQGRDVSRLDYVGHPLATESMEALILEFSAREGVHQVAAAHRVGHLEIGDVALYVAASASHRSEAFKTVAEFVDKAKEVLPIWKKQYFQDGHHEWTNCP